MPFTDPNAAAAANAGRGLANLANFIYEQQVSKPQAQAQTAQTQATTQATQQETQARTLANKQALFEQLSAHPIINPDAIDAAANAQTTDTSTQANAPQSSTTSMPNGPVGDGESGPAPAGSVKTVNNTPAGGEVNMAGSSRQGPDTISTNLPPLDNDSLAPSLTAPGKSVFGVSSPAGTSGQPGVSATPPVTSPVSPVPPISSPGKTPGSFSYRDNLGTPIDQLPDAARTELLNQMRKPFTAAGLPVTDQELIGHYQQAQAQMIPNPMRNPNLMLTGIHGGQPDFVSRTALQEFGGGAGGGNQGNAARIFDVTLGHYVDNPAFTKPTDVESTQSSLDSNTQAQKLLDSAKAALAANPSVVGPKLLGQTVANLTRSGEAIAGHPANKTAEATIRRFQSGGFLTSLGGLKGVGRLDIPVVEAAKKGMPEQSDTAETWQKYFEQAQNALTANRQALLQEYGGQTGGKASLPPVDGGLPSVSAPGATPAPTASAVPVLTPEQAKAAPKGTHYQTTDGRELWK